LKKFQYSPQTSFIKGPDKEPEYSKPFNWERLIYVVILIILIFTLIMYFFNRYYYVTARGQVILDKFEVNFPDDIQVTRFLVKEGEHVEIGDTLFSLVYDDDNGNGGASISIGGGSGPEIDRNDWVLREIAMANKNIALLEIELQNVRDNRKLKQSTYDNIRQEVTLDISPGARLREIKDALKEYDFREKNITSEIASLKEYIRTITPYLYEQKNNRAAAIAASAAASEAWDSLHPPYYYSKTEGTVSRIYTRPFETLYREAVVMDIIEFKDVFIRAYIEENDVDKFKEGDLVNLVFTDGTKSKGMVSLLEISTVQIPKEFTMNYEELTRRLVAKITPLNEEEMQKWKRYYKIGVKVRKPRFF
jgi:multidrug resistance efflux pump